MANQKLNATITIGGAIDASLGRAVGAVNSRLGAIGQGIVGKGFAQSQARIGDALARTDAQLASARGQVLDIVGAYYALQGAIGAPVRAAMQFESAMADVTKVVAFDGAADLASFEAGLLEITKRVPLAVDGLAQIAAAAGQAGIAKEDILAFTESAALIGTAFDISADEAGTAMSKLMTGLDLTLGEAILLTDAINHLSNSQASSAAEVLDVVRRTGAMGKQYGFTAEQVAGLGSAMIASGAQSDVAATSFLNMGRALTRGASATKRQQQAYKTLGLDATKVAADMQRDATGTTMQVMEALAALPAEMRASMISDLFGDEARALGPLLGNLDLVRESLGMVADEAAYSGSAMREAASRSKTFENRLKLFNNALSRVSIRLGEALIPALTTLIETVEPLIDRFAEWVAVNPDLVAAIATGTAGLIAFKGALVGLRFVGLLGKSGALNLLALGMGTVGRAGAHLWGAARASVALQTALGAMEGGKALGTMGTIGTALRGMVLAVPGIGMLGSGLAAIGAAIAGISAPVWATFAAIAAAVAAAGFAIYKYWDRISAIFTGVSGRIGEELAPALEYLAPVIEKLSPAFDLLKMAINPIGSAIQYVSDNFGDLMGWLGQFSGWFSQENLDPAAAAEWETWGRGLADGLINGIKAPLVKLESLKQEMLTLGKDIVGSLWDGMQAKFGEFIEYVKSIPGQIIEAFGKIDLTSAISMPNIGGWFSGAEDAPAPANVPHAAVGGLFRPGPLVVGERGPELRFESRAGFIATNRQYERLRRASESISRARSEDSRIGAPDDGDTDLAVAGMFRDGPTVFRDRVQRLGHDGSNADSQQYDWAVGAAQPIDLAAKTGGHLGMPRGDDRDTGRSVAGMFRPSPVVVGERVQRWDRNERKAEGQQHDRAIGAAESINLAATTVGRSAAAQAGHISIGGITIHGPQGANPSQIADEVMRRLKAATRGALYDGARA